jgi:hypothetical protein
MSRNTYGGSLFMNIFTKFLRLNTTSSAIKDHIRLFLPSEPCLNGLGPVGWFDKGDGASQTLTFFSNQTFKQLSRGRSTNWN